MIDDGLNDEGIFVRASLTRHRHSSRVWAQDGLPVGGKGNGMGMELGGGDDDDRGIEDR